MSADAALLKAALSGSAGAVKVALASGASVGCQDEDGDTALAIACYEGHLECVALLIEAGSSLEQANKAGKSPLFQAAYSGQAAVVSELLRAGAAVEGGGADRTPLLVAAQYGRVAVVKLLLEAGANAEARSADGRSAWDLAANKASTVAEVRALLPKPSRKKRARPARDGAIAKPALPGRAVALVLAALLAAVGLALVRR
jgi:ankyrin repeat protein